MRHSRKGVLVEAGDVCELADWECVRKAAQKRGIWESKNGAGEVVFCSPPWGMLKKDAPYISAKEWVKGLAAEESEDSSEDSADEDILSKTSKNKTNTYVDLAMTKTQRSKMAANLLQVTNPAAVVVLHLHPGLFHVYTKSFEQNGWTVCAHRHTTLVTLVGSTYYLCRFCGIRSSYMLSQRRRYLFQ